MSKTKKYPKVIKTDLILRSPQMYKALKDIQTIYSAGMALNNQAMVFFVSQALGEEVPTETIKS